MVAESVPYAVLDVGLKCPVCHLKTKLLFFLFQSYIIVVQNRNFDLGSREFMYWYQPTEKVNETSENSLLSIHLSTSQSVYF